MKVKDEIEGGMTKEHGYLGEAKQHIMKGHTPGGAIQRRTLGTSKLMDESAGNVSKSGTNEKY